MQPLPYTDPGRPDLRSPVRFMVWTARGQIRSQLGGMLFGSLWMLSMALVPAAVSRAIDRGIRPHDLQQLLLWSGAVLALAACSALTGTLRHRYAVENWMRASFRSMQLIGWHVAESGQAVPRAMPTGKVVATVASDAPRMAAAYDTFGRFTGAVVTFFVVAAILLTMSVPMGLLVLLGVPLLLGSLALVMKPLQARQAAQREESGRLTELGADTVAGLRVLRGIGGEHTFLARYQQQSQRVRTSGVRVASLQSTLDAAQVFLPGVFMLVVTWAGARAVQQGSLTPGQLVAFYGYAAFLVMPLRTATEMADKFIRARVAARKIIDVLSAPSDNPPGGTAALPSAPGALADPTSGVEVAPGQVVAIVSERPEDSSALADRLGRFGAVATDATYAGVRLADVPIEQVRRRIVVSETDPRLFTGHLRDELDPTGQRTDADLLAALEVASAADVLDALDGGLDAEVEERGRSFSGGQRQRLALARVLLAQAETLVLVEPTSAVDAHTEARIAQRLVDARRGHTTVLMTASPLVLDHVDEVFFLHDGRLLLRGSHHDLLHEPAYRRVVLRDVDDDAADTAITAATTETHHTMTTEVTP